MSNYSPDIFSSPNITSIFEHQPRVSSEVQLLMAIFNLASHEARQRFVDWLDEPEEPPEEERN